MMDGAASGDNTRRGIAGVLFIGTVDAMYNVYSAVHSSLWSAENFGTDEPTRSAARYYVGVAVVKSGVLALLTAWIARRVWPLIAWAVVNAMMVPMYARALRNAADRNGGGRYAAGLAADVGVFAETPAGGSRRR